MPSWEEVKKSIKKNEDCFYCETSRTIQDEYCLGCGRPFKK